MEDDQKVEKEDDLKQGKEDDSNKEARKMNTEEYQNKEQDIPPAQEVPDRSSRMVILEESTVPLPPMCRELQVSLSQEDCSNNADLVSATAVTRAVDNTVQVELNQKKNGSNFVEDRKRDITVNGVSLIDITRKKNQDPGPQAAANGHTPFTYYRGVQRSQRSISQYYASRSKMDMAGSARKAGRHEAK